MTKSNPNIDTADHKFEQRFMKKPNNAWRTADEIWFLDRLGLHREATNNWIPMITYNSLTAWRLDLLMMYRSSMENRVDWGELDQELIADYLEHEIGRITEECKAFELDTEELMDLLHPEVVDFNAIKADPFQVP